MLETTRVDLEGEALLCTRDNSMVETTRVDLEGGGKMDRTRPLSLQPFISQCQWDALADEVDAVMVKLGDTKRALLFLIGYTLFGFWVFLSDISFFSFSSLLPIAGVLFFLIPLVCWHMSARNSSAELKTIAERHSWNLPQITINYKEDRIPYYFAFQHNPDGVETGLATANSLEATAIPVAVLGFPAPPRTVAERLSELESIKGSLSPEDYQQTKQRILSTI